MIIVLDQRPLIFEPYIIVKLNEKWPLLTKNVLRIYVQQKYSWPRQRNVAMSIYLNEYNGSLVDRLKCVIQFLRKSFQVEILSLVTKGNK